MKYTKEERLEIGRQIYHSELTKHEAATTYGIGVNSARDYMRLYRDTNELPPKNGHVKKTALSSVKKLPQTMEDIHSMTREELIDALVMARINEARLKKGYMVEGVGADKKYVLFDKENTK